MISDHSERRTRMTATNSDFDQLEPISASSTKQAVYDALRAAIVQQLPAGTKLPLSELASRMNVSTMPVRSALVQLQAEGLVTNPPHRPAEVSALSTADLSDLYLIREPLEVAAGQHACPRLTDATIRKMADVQAEMHAIVQGTAPEIGRYLALDWELHDLCYFAAQRPKLFNAIRMYRAQAERYFRLYLSNPSEEPVVHTDLVNQDNFVEACAARDPVALSTVLHSMFEDTRHRVTQVLQRNERATSSGASLP
ncbi:GntR family transcriptional regulator [Leekyejoonella antrihumi]|uniref:GntR family transcriptional regulator n=1 Tax=Leekyejoonella antrihumi TaxID=1660198 RepID=A0A563DRZ9_9MICO|nr:GntR family transcriptional regulator [Leekyejoonella antrihumi]